MIEETVRVPATEVVIGDVLMQPFKRVVARIEQTSGGLKFHPEQAWQSVVEYPRHWPVRIMKRGQ